MAVLFFCRGRSRGFSRPGGGAPARAQRSGSRGERRRDGERELCRRRQSERFEVRADEGRAAAASVIPGKFIRKRERPVAVLFFCRGRSRGFSRPGGGAPARAQRSGSRGERRRDGERELCRRRQSERFEVRADEGRAAAATVIPEKFIRKRERPVAVLFFCLLKKPRRILCHHGRKRPDPFSLAACAWKKTRPAPRVRGLFPDSRQMMRAAG